MKSRLFFPFAAIVISGFVASLSGCSSDNDKNDRLRIPYLDDGVLTLYYPNLSVAYTNIEGGTPPYNATCESDILKVGIDKDMPGFFRHEVSGVGSANVIISDAAGDKVTVPVIVKYSDISLRVIARDVEVVGDNLTIAQHEELKEKALDRIPVEDNGSYRLVYSGIDSGTLYVHKTAMDAYRYEGTFRKVGQCEGSVFGGYEFKYDNIVHNLYWELYTGPSTRKELLPRYTLNEDLTEQFLPEYPELESLITVQFLE